MYVFFVPYILPNFYLQVTIESTIRIITIFLVELKKAVIAQNFSSFWEQEIKKLQIGKYEYFILAIKNNMLMFTFPTNSRTGSSRRFPITIHKVTVVGIPFT